MKSTSRKAWIAGAAFLLALVPALPAQQHSQTLVTVMPKADRETSQKIQEDAVQVYSSSKAAELTGWNWAGDSHLQLLLLLDDSTSTNFAQQIGDLKSFIQALPPSTEVGLAYMQNGRAVMRHEFSFDHAAVSQSIRLTQGLPGGNGSPYFVITEIAKKWPAKTPAPRREVLMITDGVDPYSGALFDPNNPYYLTATENAQKAGLILYSIYYRGAGAFSRNMVVTDGGQNYLSGISQATGGHCYLQGLWNPVTLQPFLIDLAKRLQNQYELSYRTETKDKLANLKVKVQAPHVEVEAPQRVPVQTPIAGGK